MNETALVTGAAGGIGLEFCQLLGKKGYNLVMVDLNETGLLKAKELLGKDIDTEISTFTQDLSQEDAADRIVDFLKAENIHIDLLFNNAGFGNFGYFTESSWAKDRAMLQVHMITTTHLTKLLLPAMVEKGRGYILNNASVAAFVPGPLMSTYHASKSYLLNFTQALANEMKGSGIKATVLCPGMTKTNFAKANGNDDPNIKFNIMDSDYVAEYAFNALMKGKVVAVPGFWNQLSAFLPRLLSRNRVANMVGNIQRKNHAKRADQKAVKS
ncbi:SDR family NAD(P)-dependent oxidoreductase [Roseivirga sp.]|uniref:SDR family NAD(P)-dependent oxidoreductase n=1 Tax=Roseivirga sp. TaxID=1964215 RepID=UPI003B8BE51C